MMRQEKARALVLTRYESKGASSRIRLIQFVPTFEKLMTVRVQSLFSDSYVDGIGKRPRTSQFSHGFPGLVKRIVFLGMLIAERRRFDVVILQQELFPFVPAWVESWILRQIGAGILIIDIDDGNHIRYEHSDWLIRKVCSQKFQKLWRLADQVVCGSQRLVEDVTPFLKVGGRIALIPSVPPEETFRLERRPAPSPPFIIGWIGSPSTAKDLELVRGPLSKIAEDLDIEFHVVGAEMESSSRFMVRCSPWSPDAERSLLQRMHVGIMPIFDSDFRARKCGYKLIQYMTVGIPVVASDVGGNRSIVVSGNVSAGYIAGSEGDWVSALKALLTNEDVRKDHGRAASRIASERYSFSSACAQWERCLRDLLEGTDE